MTNASGKISAKLIAILGLPELCIERMWGSPDLADPSQAARVEHCEMPSIAGSREMGVEAEPPSGLAKYVSLFGGILPYRRSLLSRDLVAGVTLAALAIPEVMGYTKIAGTPVIVIDDLP